MDSIPQETLEAVARIICCARFRCEGCLGNGEGECFELDLWNVEATAALSSPAVQSLIEKARAEERERAVAWLRERESDIRPFGCFLGDPPSSVIDFAADAIERGDHSATAIRGQSRG